MELGEQHWTGSAATYMTENYELKLRVLIAVPVTTRYGMTTHMALPKGPA